MKRSPFNVDFTQAPLLVIWEVTRACALACRHCRADAIDIRHPDELTLDEGKKLLNDIAAMGTPVVVFTGGDPIQRADLEELIRHGKSLGLRVGTIPAATPRLTLERVEGLRDAGLDQMAVSLDGPDAATHDELRQVPGAFEWALRGCNFAREAGIPLQINTVLGAWNQHLFDPIAELVESLGIVFWEVFFLVPTGRGESVKSCTPEQFEEIFAKLHAIQQRSDYIVKVTEGPHYRRYVQQQRAVSGAPSDAAAAGHPGGAPPGGSKGHPGAQGLAFSQGGVNAGKGFAFVDHVGQVYPSGFLPIECGNIREKSIIETYRNHPTFLELRDTSLLEGRCGRCKYKNLCGGSRARAYALTGSLHAEEAFCVYNPPAV